MNKKIIISPTEKTEELFYYQRGVSPTEMIGSVNGQNTRKEATTLTNRGTDNNRYGFGLNERGHTGVSPSVVDDIALDLIYYANLGGGAELYKTERGKYPLSSEDANIYGEYNTGYILTFASQSELEKSRIHWTLGYGNRWRTTSMLPAEIDNQLYGITPAPYEKAIWKEGSFSWIGPRHPVFNRHDFLFDPKPLLEYSALVEG